MHIGAAAAVALLVAATAAPASPTGTPQSNAPHGGKGSPVDLPFGHRRDAAPATTQGGTAPATPRRRLTQAEWRRDYIARHGHDLQPAVHPGH